MTRLEMVTVNSLNNYGKKNLKLGLSNLTKIFLNFNKRRWDKEL